MKIENTMTARFRIVRLLDNDLVPADCKISVTFALNDKTDADQMAGRFMAMKEWIHSYVDGSIAFNLGTDLDTTLFEQVANNVILCPDEPTDPMLLALIHSKLTAIADGHIEITKTTIESDIASGLMQSISGTTDDWLPDITAWMGEKYFFDKPWWCRSDSSTIDLFPMEGDDLSVKPDLGIDLYEYVMENRVQKSSNQKSSKTNDAEIITPKFSLKLITDDE